MEGIAAVMFIGTMLMMLTLGFATSSYMLGAFSALGLIMLPGSFGMGGGATFAGVILAIVMMRWIGRKKKFRRMDRQMYREGKRDARLGRHYDQGYHDGY